MENEAVGVKGGQRTNEQTPLEPQVGRSRRSVPAGPSCQPGSSAPASSSPYFSACARHLFEVTNSAVYTAPSLYNVTTCALHIVETEKILYKSKNGSMLQEFCWCVLLYISLGSPLFFDLIVQQTLGPLHAQSLHINPTAGLPKARRKLKAT